MNISGSKFESRNVLDRIEDTGKELMKPEVRATLTHGVAFMLVGKIGVLFGAIMSGLIIWLTYNSEGLFATIILTVVLAIGLLIVFSAIVGIAEIMIYRSHAGIRTLTIREAVIGAWPFVNSWAYFLTWSALLILTGFLIIITIWIINYLLGNDTVFVWGLSGIMSIGILVSLFWILIAVGVGKPGYILRKDTTFSKFLALRHLTIGRWKSVFINIFVVSLIVGLGSGILYEIIETVLGTSGILSGIIEGIGSMRSDLKIEKILQVINNLVVTNLKILEILNFILQMIIGSILQVFLWKFSAIMYSDITTPKTN